MKKISTLLLIVLLMSGFSIRQSKEIKTEVFVGSTPCDSPVKAIFNIHEKDSIDFMRWGLILSIPDSGQGFFSIDLSYGIGQPNTLSFISGGNKFNTEGTIAISKLQSGATVYTLNSKDLKSKLSLIRLSNSILHILTAEKRLMVGNGGWSYSLGKKDPIAKSVLPSSMSALNMNIENGTLTFSGRTPCEPVNTEYNMALGESCLKIKWLLRMYIDPVTRRPTSFNLMRTGHRSSIIEGTWHIENGTAPGIIICRLNQRKPHEPMLFWIADGNVMYFLDKSMNIMTGDENFSFVLNRSDR